MHVNKQYKISPLHLILRLAPISDLKNSEINKIHNQSIHIIKSINYIVERRCNSINTYRSLEKERSHFLHEQNFDRGNYSTEIKQIQEKQSPHLWSIKIDTEIYFVYSRILLDTISELIFLYDRSLPANTNHNFASLYKHIAQKGCKDDFLRKILIDNLKWYISMIKMPRDVLFVHDEDSSGIGFADHGVDFNIGKFSEYHDESMEKSLHDIIKRHKELDYIRKNPYIHPMMREIIHHFDCLNDDEIIIINKISEKFPVFPYIVDVHSKIQSFLRLIEEWISHKNMKEHGFPF